jgi:hypothetical protein
LKTQYAGVANDCARRRTIKKENMSLNQPANRYFCKEFETYIEYARRVAPYVRI